MIEITRSIRFDEADMATASAQGFRDGVASLTVQAADTQPAPVPDEAIAIDRTRDLASNGGRWPSDWVEAYRRGYSDRAARDPADSVLEDAALWFAERDNVLHSFWVLLGEAEVHADNDNNPLLKHQVEEFYRQWNALNGTTLGPRWVSRAARKQGGA